MKCSRRNKVVVVEAGKSKYLEVRNATTSEHVASICCNKCFRETKKELEKAFKEMTKKVESL